MRRINVETPSKSYDIVIEAGLLKDSGEFIMKVCGGERAMLVSDDVVSELYGSRAEASLSAAGYTVSRFVFPHGERSKTLKTYASLLESLAGANLSRKDVIVALGGGVTGDLAGFAASTWLRGIGFAQIPTTLLAMVDSSVGGKTGIDIPDGKNLVGAFYQPDIVLCDYSLLDTLPGNVFCDGCSEMIKHGVIASERLFDALWEPPTCVFGESGSGAGEDLGVDSRMGAEDRLEDIIAQNVTIKRDIVCADERENGIRRLLNFGHTLGHGIEKHSGYTMGHGECVAIGMALVSRGAARMGLCDTECHNQIVEMLRRYKLPAKTSITPESLINSAAFDKKRVGNSIMLILPERIGKCVEKRFSMDEFSRFVNLSIEM